MLLLCLTILAPVSQLSGSQVEVRGCGESAECIKLERCPQYLRKAHSPDVNERNAVRKVFCGFNDGNMLVCCPKTPVMTESTTVSIGTGTNVDGDELLPQQCGNPIAEDKIHGGEHTPLGAHPWVVALGYHDHGKMVYACGGSVINSRYVLTAAHCVHPKDLQGRKLVAINLGDWDLSNDGVDCEITGLGPVCAESASIVARYDHIAIHPDYNKRFQTSDDIALIRLNITIDFRSTGIEPICLPPTGQDFPTADTTKLPLAAGWGLTENRTGSNILMSVGLPFADPDICKRRYHQRYGSEHICAGGVEGKDSCDGDSGGPLIMADQMGPPFVQIGIVSIGSRFCGTENFPGLYTSVSHYRQWITQNLQP